MDQFNNLLILMLRFKTQWLISNEFSKYLILNQKFKVPKMLFLLNSVKVPLLLITSHLLMLLNGKKYLEDSLKKMILILLKNLFQRRSFTGFHREHGHHYHQ